MALVDVALDSAGQSTEIEIIELYVAVGDSVAEGQPLLEVATDKANSEIAAPQAGTVTTLHFGVGDIVEPPTQPLLVLDTGP